MTLPTVEAALSQMLSCISVLSGESLALNRADGRWLAQGVAARRDQPPFDASAMDGWAVRSLDLESGAPLRIVGESAAGNRADVALGPGEAVRISTGAPLPSGADRVVIREEAQRHGHAVTCASSASSPPYIRARACDFAGGQLLLQAGERLNPWRLALAASAGTTELICGARPRVSILATGNEIVEPGTEAGPDQIYDAAGPALAAFVVRHGGTATRLPAARDSQDSILEAVSRTAFDVLVTIGGASVGDHDLVKPALRTLGAEVLVEGVAMRPGKPVWFARLPDGRLVLGLPGNPASALVCAELFLSAILARLQGGVPGDRFETAILTEDLPANGPRDHYMRASLVSGPDGCRRATPFRDQDSSLVTIMAAANALIRREPSAPAISAGAIVRVVATP